MLKATAKCKCTQQCHNEFYVHNWHGNRILISYKPRRYWLKIHKKKKKKTSITMLAISSDSHVDVRVIRIRLCAGDLELLLLCGRHDKYSGWKTKARINLWICAVRSDYLLFVRVYHHYFVCLIAIPRYIFMDLLRYATGRRHTILGQSHFQYRLQKYMWKYRKCNSHIPLPHMKKPHARNGNVTRNLGGNRLEGKHTLMFIKL